jgi:hypothetical protein
VPLSLTRERLSHGRAQELDIVSRWLYTFGGIRGRQRLLLLGSSNRRRLLVVAHQRAAESE